MLMERKDLQFDYIHRFGAWFTKLKNKMTYRGECFSGVFRNNTL